MLLKSGKQDTEIIHGNGYLEVKPAGVKKIKLVNILLDKISNNKPIDFLFYLGNDSEDETVFQFLKTQDNRNYFQQDCVKYICVLEKKPSEAQYYIEDLDNVKPLLQRFQTAAQNRKRNFSYADLSTLQVDMTKSGGVNLKTDKRQHYGSRVDLTQYI